ncbi:Putative electron transport protein YccM [Planctomycetes bacterium Pla163]|uniref:Electron transport protein YccM n=1 Tax=Rohdeia mirabilis TaxID=2528008 RepID=A0A518CYF1_9BACT|nr:Putative electron transport protein YccM [Planctomycetes bacterium Pla163]
MPWQHTKFDAGALPAARAMKAGCGPVPGVAAKPRSKRGRWRALVLLAVHVVIAARIWYWLTFGETISPLEPSEAGQTLTRGIVNAGFVLFGVAIVSTLVFGRFFCGWACHVVALQDGCAWLLGKLGLSPKPVRSRLLAFVPLLVAFWMFVAPSLLQALDGTLPKSVTVALTTEDFWARFPGPAMAAVTFLAVGFLIVWLLGAKGFCTYGCPYGAVFAVADRFAKGRIRVTDDCNGCGHCTAVCTSNVEVHTEVASPARMVTDAGCMKCLDCVSACPKDALFFGFKARATVPEPAAEAPGPPKRARAFDFTWPEEIALAVVFLLTVVFAYRRLYGLVPDLLAVTIALAAAFCTIVGWRLVTRRDLTVQHLRMKVDGRLTGRGRIAALGLVLFAVFTVHSGVVRYHDTASQARFAAFRIGGAEAVDEARAALGHLDWLVRYGLWHEPQIDLGRGRLLARLDQLAPAEAAFEAALARLDEDAAVRLELIDVQMARASDDPLALERASAELARSIDQALEELGDAAPDPRRLGPLAARAARIENLTIGPTGPRFARPVANHARLLYAVGDDARGAERRTFLGATFPSDPATLELEQWLSARGTR